MPKLRQNPLTGDWVIIAPERAARPEDFASWRTPIDKEPKIEGCLFCEGGKAWAERYEDVGTEFVYVIPNKYPAFVQNQRVIEDGKGLYFGCESIGAHEVIIMRNHMDNLFDAPKDAIYDLFRIFKQRYQLHGKDPEVDYVMAINNQREEAGASIEHPHSQLMASAFIPPLVDRELKRCSKYYLEKGRCLVCDMIRKELDLNERVVMENDGAIAMTPYAPRFPFETWVLPKKHESDFRYTESLQDFSDLFGQLMLAMREKLGIVPMNFFIHSCPTLDAVTHSYHWHLEITPRLARLGGYEVGGDTFIDIMAPEKAAYFLRR